MIKLVEFLKEYGFALWIGGATSLLFGYSVAKWQWWVYCVTALILIEWYKSK